MSTPANVEPPTQTLSTVEELHKALAEHNLARLNQFKLSVNKRLEEIKTECDKDVEAAKVELKELEGLDEETNPLKKKIIEDKKEALKKTIESHDNKTEVTRLTNTLEAANRRFQEMQIFGC